jgi:hypothetical protein
MDKKRRPASILSAGAVVLRLGFVGYELRQNTAMMRGQTMQSISDTYVGYVTAIGLDPALAELFRRFHNGDTAEDFTATENTRIIVFFNAFVRPTSIPDVMANQQAIGNRAAPPPRPSCPACASP